MTVHRLNEKSTLVSHNDQYLESYQRLVSFWIDVFIDQQKQATLRRIASGEKNTPGHTVRDAHKERDFSVEDVHGT